ncbi:hypothetical protein CASFOL_018652 [Castilleja foliolosa]|uniref:MATH domain-containing protein n=1 Tax=Castilleja foliolosa TaxID=1961234 RepID=A0ABD3D6L5_9LAMI
MKKKNRIYRSITLLRNVKNGRNAPGYFSSLYYIGRARRFHALKQEWGFKKFISKKDLTDPSNGYIVDDKCVFGAEVIVNENKAVTECMSLKSVEYKHEFKISNFSTCKGEWFSEEFTVGHKWYKYCLELL